MITALLRVRRIEGCGEALGLTVAALLPAITQGLVCDAVILSEGARDDVTAFADALGADLIIVQPGKDPWLEGATLAKQDWLFCLDAGDIPSGAWIQALRSFVAASPPERSHGRIPRNAGSVREAIREVWRRQKRRVEAGDVVGRQSLVSGLPALRPRRIGAVIRRAAMSA